MVASQALFYVDSQHLVVVLEVKRRALADHVLVSSEDYVRGNEVLHAFGHILDSVDNRIRRCH